MPKAPEDLRKFSSFVKIVEHLRGPDGCPWDKEQTHKTLTAYAIEETHEFVEAIDKENYQEMKEELGDMLLQVVLHSEIARQEQHFDIYDVIETIGHKMVRRHPHVFADVIAKNSDAVLKNWEQIKDQEKPKKKKYFDFPKSLPANLYAQKLGAKTKRYNFDWHSIDEVLHKVEEELTELKQAIKNQTKKEQQLELGDLLFSVVQLARHLDFDAEQALRLSIQKFESRFSKMLELLESEGLTTDQLSNEELEVYWQRIK